MSTWNNAGSGSWKTAGNWTVGVPNAVGATADLTILTHAGINHAVDLQFASITVSALYLASSSNEKYTISNGILTMNVASGSASIQVTTQNGGTGLGSVLAADLYLALYADTQIYTYGTNSHLSILGLVSGSGDINKTGLGSLTLGHNNAGWDGDLLLNSGSVNIGATDAMGLNTIEFDGDASLYSYSNVTIHNALKIKDQVSATIAAAAASTLTIDLASFECFGKAGTVLHFGTASKTGAISFETSKGSIASINPASMAIDGGTLINAGGVNFLSSTFASTYIAAAARLDLNGYATTINHLTGAGEITDSNTTAGLTLLKINETGIGSFSGQINDGARHLQLEKSGQGTLALAGNSSYSGGTTVSDGTLRAGAANVLGHHSDLNLLKGTILDLGGFSQSIGTLAGEGKIINSNASAGGATLTLNAGKSQSPGYFFGTIGDGAGKVNLVVAGDQWFTGESTFTGSTRIKAGAELFLHYSGSIAKSSTVTIEKAGALSLTEPGQVTNITNLVNAGTVRLEGSKMVLTAQTGDIKGTFSDYQQSGGWNGSLHVHMAAATKNLSAASAHFVSWSNTKNLISITGNALDNAITGTSQADHIYGKDGKDSLQGLAGKDVISGGNGDDKLYGGLGNDKLTGGSGHDYFIFNTATASNVDTIMDFSHVDDTIRLDNAIFTGLTGTGTLSSSQFRINTTGHAADSNDHVIYNKLTGNLYYDKNGSASGSEVQIAHLAAGLALTHDDFYII